MLFVIWVVGKTLVYKYTALFGRVCNGCSHDFKFAETSSKVHKILYTVRFAEIYMMNEDHCFVIEMKNLPFIVNM